MSASRHTRGSRRPKKVRPEGAQPVGDVSCRKRRVRAFVPFAVPTTLIGRRPRSSSGDRPRGPAGPTGPTRPITSPIAIVAPTADIQAIPSPPGSSLEEAHPTRRTGPPSNAPGRCSRSAHRWPNRNAAPSRGRSATTTLSSPATRGKSKIATRNAGRSATRPSRRKSDCRRRPVQRRLHGSAVLDASGMRDFAGSYVAVDHRRRQERPIPTEYVKAANG